MGELIPYEVFEQKQREKKYGSAAESFKGRGFRLDYDFGPDEPTPDDYVAPSDCEE
jgi:hypothetical protein